MQENHKRFPIKLMAEFLQVSASGFYAWRKNPTDREQKNLKLLRKIEDIHRSSRRTYGSPRIYRQLKALGACTSKSRVERLMRREGIRAKTKRKFRVTTNSKHNFPVAENKLERRFEVAEANKVWASDITYISTKEGWLFLAVVIDLYSRHVVGWSMAETMTKELCLDAMQMAIGRRNPAPGLLHHSDRGSQYACHEFRKLLAANKIDQSMSRKGNCWDNACVESFFHTLKTELIHHESYANRAEARTSIFDWIEVFYNRQRIHSTLGYRSPAEYEMSPKVA
jgi:putative transposase